MRVVLLTAHSADGDAQHRYIAQRLLDEFQDQLVAIVVATGMKRPPMRRVRQLWRRYSIAQLLSRFAFRLAGKVRGADTERQRRFSAAFFPDGENGSMPGGEKVIRVPSHNGEECRLLVERLNADVVVVYGTLIIGQKVIDTCKRAINLHTGLSPRYRGSDTIFWPLHNGEPEYVGITVHRLVRGVDAGAILARGRPEIVPDDDEHALFAKGVKLGADLLCSAVRREFDGAANPVEQVLSEGREYRSVERTVLAEWTTWRKLRAGLLGKGFAEWREEF